MRSISLSMSRKHLRRNAHFFLFVSYWFVFFCLLYRFPSPLQHTITHNDIKTRFTCLFASFSPLFQSNSAVGFFFSFHAFPWSLFFSYRFVLGIIFFSASRFGVFFPAILCPKFFLFCRQYEYSCYCEYEGNSGVRRKKEATQQVFHSFFSSFCRRIILMCKSHSRI